MATPSRETFVALDWLRFALAIYLVMFHTLKNYPEVQALPMVHSLLSLGFFSTSTFFVLSGFLLTHVYLGPGRRAEINKKSFFIKRLSSLYPIHILALLLAIPLALTASGSMGTVMVDHNVNGWHMNAPETQAYALDTTGWLVNLGLNLSLLQAWNPLYTVFNQPAWSLSALLFFYITFPYLAPRLRATYRPALLLTVLCLLYLTPSLYMFFSDTVTPIAHGMMHRNPLLRLPEFLAGIVLYRVYDLKPAWLAALTGHTGKWWSIGFILLCLWATAMLYQFVGGQWYYLVHNGLLLPAQLLLVMLCARSRLDPRTWSAGVAARLGIASLSIFALHIPLSMMASKIEKASYALFDIITTDATLGMLPHLATQEERSLWVYPIYLAVVIVASALFQTRLVNRMRDRLRARFLKPKRGTRTTYSSQA
ncbi:acyltransferase family protein [Larsenimonas rhizosphaerae]|uniref:Acyltransferase n=1 Tax=Larsenimonas rhizosphaerae TaxID=2944682 RepID=A0AA41ZHE4_9GAMM|nr:acyltransferase [Larsenimonas rhizosphaerae]MCX2524620.1 acyltransferase [Larsenimonas rhizosphaerae]